jgi:hypothetical protein
MDPSRSIVEIYDTGGLKISRIAAGMHNKVGALDFEESLVKIAYPLVSNMIRESQTKAEA